MIEVFNSISNIAVHIENDVFKNCSDFLVDKSTEEIHQDIYNHCTKIIESEFEKVKTIKSAISKDKKQDCIINENGKYIVSYVSVDNIELIDVDFSLGSIFTIYENEMNPDNIKAAIYVAYGPTFQLVFASKDERVKFFSYKDGEFVQQDSFMLNEKGKINSPAGMRKEWDSKHKELVESFFSDGYRLRFSDSLVLDTHQILFKKGGIYSSPNNEIELFFEAYPIAFILELVGGEAIDGDKRILDIIADDLHQKTALYFGSKHEISKVKETLGK
jgi:fructose-1,6-bisphosphatase I